MVKHAPKGRAQLANCFPKRILISFIVQRNEALTSPKYSKGNYITEV